MTDVTVTEPEPDGDWGQFSAARVRAATRLHDAVGDAEAAANRAIDALRDIRENYEIGGMDGDLGGEAADDLAATLAAVALNLRHSRRIAAAHKAETEEFR